MKKYFILGGIIVITGIVINYSLGGFKAVEPGLISKDVTILYGFNYKGSYSSDSLSTQISNLRKLLNNTERLGTLTIVNYVQSDLEKRGMVRQFIGIEWEKKLGPFEQSLDSLIIRPYNGVQFKLPIRPLVMPSPEKLKRLAKDFAESMASGLDTYTIEQYKEQYLIINFPFK